VGFWRREKRLNEYPLPEAVEVSYQRSAKMDSVQLLTWSEATAVNIDRLLSEYRKTKHLTVAWEAHHQALQLVGMTRAIIEQAAPVGMGL